MKLDLNVDVHHLTRVEGHGDIRIKVRDGKLTEARWDVVETPRYFEMMLKGKHYTSAALLTSRICGICSFGHALASLRATENAFGVDIPEAAKILRLLAKHGETLQSHILHLFFLAAPDFFGLPSALPLVKSDRDVVEIGVRLKGLANRICRVVGGRETHPVSLLVGGVSAFPQGLSALRGELEAAMGDLMAVADLFKTFEIPAFERETEFVALKGANDYPWIGGDLVSTDGVVKQEEEYRAVTNEYLSGNNTSKWAKLSRESYAVGSLARINNNYSFLHPAAKDVAKQLGLQPINHNPFMNNIAQLVECVHVVYESVDLINQLLDMGPKAAVLAEVRPRAGEGTGAVEVPRGILFHHYVYNKQGVIEKADCVIPTTQNNANIHYDLKALVNWMLPPASSNHNGKAVSSDAKAPTEVEVEKLCSMLVRAYDPCISCSVH